MYLMVWYLKHIMRLLALLLIPIAFSYLYNITFSISKDFVEVRYCNFGRYPEVISFEINGEKYTIRVNPKPLNVSMDLIDKVEYLMRIGRPINVYEVLEGGKIISYKEFLELEEEVKRIRRLIEEGYFCDRIVIKRNVKNFSSDSIGRYVIFGRDFETSIPCDSLSESCCIIERSAGVTVKFKEKKGRNIFLGGIICIMSLTLILIISRRR